ncbi:TniQ family protein [Ornithinimicrobium panacihumi]|uniref:TniQ family protein n=1 Tax=Ornithinimicrobium panacihumi TaxID=2008449 RepID=UPI003F8A47FD
MRPDQPWPVRPHPEPGEALSSYAVRLAEANGIHPRHLLPPGFADAQAPPGLIDRVSTAAALPAGQVRAMTLADLRPSIRGTGVLLRHGWRLHDSVTWSCPVCTERTGYRALAWRLALTPACARCQVLLHYPGAGPGIHPAPPELLELIARLQHLLQKASSGSIGARDTLSHYRRTCAGLAGTITPTWPPRAATTDLALDLDAARAWGNHPSPDPGTVATLLLTARPALGPRHTKTWFRQLLHDGPRAPGVPPPPAPRRPARRPQPPGSHPEDLPGLESLITDLATLAATTGLAPRHVPAFLPVPGDETIPHPDRWRPAHLAAVGLSMLLDLATGGPGSAATACLHLGTADTESDDDLDGLRAHAGIRGPHAALLRAGAAALIDDGIIDYQARRATLSVARRRPRLALPENRLPAINGVPGDLLAWGWMWVHTTRGPMWTSPYPLVRTGTVHLFDQAIDPETRLALHEHAQQLLTGPDLTLASPHLAPARPATAARTS